MLQVDSLLSEPPRGVQEYWRGQAFPSSGHPPGLVMLFTTMGVSLREEVKFFSRHMEFKIFARPPKEMSS